MKLSNALAQTQAALLASQFTGGFIRLFDELPPITPADGEAGTLLGIITVDGQAGAGIHFSASGAALYKSDEPWIFTALASGLVKGFRIVQPGDTGGVDISALRIDGTVAVNGTPADMNWENTTVVNGVGYTLDTFIYLIQP